jgi:hypothetical protein
MAPGKILFEPCVLLLPLFSGCSVEYVVLSIGLSVTCW